MAKYTPMMEQYLSIKAEVPDAFLFFRLGDFYEMFFDDALLASRELEITLTGRDAGAEERVPMCGVPYHSADAYISRLIQKGYKVAICEQVEDPALAKGVVKREIVRIITPGTAMEGRHIGEAANNYVVVLCQLGLECGLAACDLGTGELYATSQRASLSAMLDEAAVYAPAEIVTPPELKEQVRKLVAAWPKPPLVSEWSELDPSLAESQFGADGVAVLTGSARQCVDLLMSYLHATQKRSLGHITGVRWYESSQYMTLDPFTRRNLELTESARDRTKKGSLYGLLDRTTTAMGSRLLRRWIEKPLMSRRLIEDRLEAVDKLYAQLIVREELRAALKKVYDLERLAGRIAFGSANARDLTALKASLMRVPEITGICLQSGSSTLASLAESVDVCDDIRVWIDETIVDDPPVSVREGGMIRPGYSERLDQLREASIGGKQWIAELERKERERTGIKSLKVGFNKVFGYYIEVTKANVASLPEGIYERKQTLANAERFVTPELKEKEALILEAEEKLADLEYEIFSDLRQRIAGQVQRLQRLAEFLATVDALQSLGTVAAERRYTKPHIVDGYDLKVEEGRHPVVEAVLEDGQFVANGAELTRDNRMMLITGPNMAGKSTYMRQVALWSVMAQIGSFLPARSAQMPIVDRIFTRIGAGDDLVSGQSTFMMEMKEIELIMSWASERSLVIIDELGRGTSTTEGMAIAQAVIEHLHDRIGCKTLVSTHFHELARLEESLQFLRNFCMAVRESGEDVTFLRKLERGAASTSYGIYCARIAGLPDTVIERAYALLSRMEGQSDGRTAGVDEVRAIAAQPAGAREEAGVPDARADRAAVVSAADAAGNPELVYRKTPRQLSLFEEPEAFSRKTRTAADSAASKAIGRIREADLMNMTPMQAMNFLYEIKQLLGKS